MKKFLLLLVLLLAVPSFSQDIDATQIKSRMAEIRKTTNWDNPDEAKKANEQIKKLSKQLMMSKVNKNPTNESDSIHAEVQKENIETISGMWNQIMESAKNGENADILLGKPIREKIVEEYKNDESPNIKNQEYLDEMDLLVIDMSLKTVQRTIDQMERFKSIKTLIISSGKFGTAVDLIDLLKRAKNYPLEELYIINFKLFVSEIPKQIKQFKNLKLLAVFDNNINSLPTELGSLTSLKTLYIDMNPISVLLPTVGKLKHLEKLGVVKTNIGDLEIADLKKILPNCEVLAQ
jgi:Leucine-rich repeat (LRR) protein